MLKRKLCILIFTFLFMPVLAWPQALTLELIFPRSGAVKSFPTPKPIETPVEVSGAMILDVTPYPAEFNASRYELQYFLDSELIYETNGIKPDQPNQLNFNYVLDTTKYENGQHKLTVNFYDAQGKSAIAIKTIAIRNSQE